jgi:uncharacterized membrane protein YdbT with pleckstrin-like domain
VSYFVRDKISLNPDEEIQHVVRKHWFILLRDTFSILVLLALPFFLYSFIAGREISLGPQMSFLIDFSPSVLTFAGALWVLLLWAKLFGVWTDYYLDTWIITNKRVIDIEQFGFFRRQISSFRMERIQDVTIEIKGIIATLLHFGDIHVQTAGEGQEFIIRGIPHPEMVKDTIREYSDIVVEKGDAVYTSS